MRASLSALALAASLVVSASIPVAAESALWTLVASPLTTTTGVRTSFNLTATNTDPLAALISSSEIGCVVVDLPSLFELESAVVTGSTAGASWAASVTGNRVRVRTSSGGDRLETLDSVSFRVTAMPMSAGELAWGARAYRAQDCSGTGALLGVPPVVLVLGAPVTPTPSPNPTPAPTAAPTVAPTLAPTNTPTPKPTAASTARPTATPRPASTSPTGPSPTQDPTEEPARETDVPVPSAPPAASDSAVAVSPTPGATPDATAASSSAAEPVGGEPGLTPPGGAGSPVSVNVSPLGAVERTASGSSVPISLGPLGVLGGVDIWIVPSLLIAMPGLLLVVFVALQGVGALAWVPAIRRLRGDEPRKA